MKGMLRFALAASAALALTLPAYAQEQPLDYDVKTINFDLWCQEQEHLDADRCDKRLPDDEAKFEAFRAKIEKYELSHLQDKQREHDFDQNVMHHDPIDEPITKADPGADDTATKTNP
jgi:hypothetical protein